MSYNLGRDEMFWRIGNEDSRKLLDDIEKLESIDFADDTGRTYLHVACSAHNLEAAKLLLKKGANPNVRDKNGRLPIMSAIGRINEKNPEFLKVFLEYGLDLDADVNGISLRETIESFDEETLNSVIRKYQNGEPQ